MDLTIITETGESLFEKLSAHQISGGHFTNGTYAPPKELIVPTVLAGFQHAMDVEVEENLPLIIAVNSNISMTGIMDKKNASAEERAKLEDEITRGTKVAFPLSEQNPDRQVVVVFYDEETPNALYNSLNARGFRLETLFKWGYGTNPDAGVIEGAENFDKVFGYPLPNDIKPLCTDITRKTGQEGKVFVVDLRTEIGFHGEPYISSDNKCRFPMTDASLFDYGVRNNPRVAAGKPEAKPA